jgi:hypothetical protein
MEVGRRGGQTLNSSSSPLLRFHEQVPALRSQSERVWGESVYAAYEANEFVLKEGPPTYNPCSILKLSHSAAFTSHHTLCNEKQKKTVSSQQS